MEESSSAAADGVREKEVMREGDTDQTSTCPESESEAREAESSSESKLLLNKSDILKAVEVVERNSLAIADSLCFSSFGTFGGLVTIGSVDHMRCFGDAAGRLQESALDAATKGNWYIDSCLRNVDALDTAVNKLLRLP